MLLKGVSLIIDVDSSLLINVLLFDTELDARITFIDSFGFIT